MGNFLEQLSTLADSTGLGAAVYPYGLMALAAFVVAVFITMAVRRALSKHPVPMSFEKAQAPGISPAPVLWGGRWLPEQSQKWHFAIAGTARSGKSLLLLLYLRSVLSQIRPGSDRRLILFDPKNELHSYLVERAQVPVHYLVPNDTRSCRWDLARDFDNPVAIRQACEVMVPDGLDGNGNDFFTETIRELMCGVMRSLNSTPRGRWNLADVVHILENRNYTAQVLGRTKNTRPTLRFMDSESTWARIEATMEVPLNDLRILAALWSRAQATFSLTDFLQREGILVLGRDPRFAALLDPVNTLLLTQLFSQLLAQGDSPTRWTHLVIDELTDAAGEGRPLPPGFMDLCERGASRGVVVVVAYQSYAHVQALYKESSDAILGNLQHQVFLRAGDYPTAEFAAKNFRRTRQWIKLHSYSRGPHGDSSTTSSDRWHDLDVVPFERFLELPCACPQKGISGYRLSPGRHDAGLFHLPGAWIAANLPKRSEDVEPYLERPKAHQYLEPLSTSDLTRLELSPPEGEDEGDVAAPAPGLG